MMTRKLTPILLAGAVAAAVTWPPGAHATGGSDCRAHRPSSCAVTDQVDFATNPANHAAEAGYWPFNGGPNQPVWVLE